MSRQRAVWLILPALAMLAAGAARAAPGDLPGRRAALDSSPTPRGLSAPAADPVQGTINPGTVEPAGAARAPAAIGKTREPRGNPLWSIPLRSLNYTRERPIFSPSRRPPPPVVAGAPPVEAPAPPPPPAAPDRPTLALVGAVVGATDGIAIFLDQSTNAIVRLKTGETHASGWTLQSVRAREATLQKDRESVVLALPAPSSPTSPDGGPAPLPGHEREL